MNEVELIRAQLCVERQHAAAVAEALSSVGSHTGDRLASLEAFRQASVEYLVWTLTRFEEREVFFHDLLRGRFAADDPDRRTAEASLARPGTSREALARLETALASSADADRAVRWPDFLQFFNGPWSTRRDELDRLFARQAKVAEWRAVSAIDADSIFDERSRYERVRTTLPAGVDLKPTSGG